MNDVLASEWLKLRSLRSSVNLLIGPLAGLVAGAVITALMAADWDSSPEMRDKFAAGDAGLLAQPVTQVCLATLAILVITGEYATGMIRTSLVAAPNRLQVLAAKALVVSGVTLVAGQVISFAGFWASRLIVGDRPPPFGFSGSAADAVPLVVADGLVITVISLVALGLGTVIRSTAGALVSVFVLLFVLPMVAMALPSSVGNVLASLMLRNLAPQLAGVPQSEAVLSQPGAVAVAVGYVVVALGAAAVVLRRRDA
ncbi:ABC-2 family transporter [Herbihabitans rhizosphaerae]|uniref:ABC-2 family transporter n=1 Tax=Herbihabitans rhizosphaerae TaxID=1872711 RepID=A0A4Q7KJH5_9PSEU|nr:ABC transporter permease subunit [Herbihabitans rhizosphaerae]RZS36575.1 ABC-2 family transporter [Herbihabitans rhizosphaerae]